VNFELKMELMSHIESDHGITDTPEDNYFECAICFDNFDVKMTLKKHIKSIHGKEVPLDSL